MPSLLLITCMLSTVSQLLYFQVGETRRTVGGHKFKAAGYIRFFWPKQFVWTSIGQVDWVGQWDKPGQPSLVSVTFPKK